MNTGNGFIALLLALLSFLGSLFGVSDEPSGYNAEAPEDGVVTVHFIDVGQGDCSFIQLPDGKNMLIDAGNNGDIKKIKSYLDSCGAERIDYLVGTHPHADHIGALDDVIKAYDIGEIYMPRVEADTKTYRDVLSAISEKGMKIKTARRGVVIFDENGARAEILAPCGGNYDDLNDYSAVIRLSFGENAFLFQGDAEKTSESEILKSGASVSADVIKAGHHGSSSSSTEKYIRAVDPAYAVVSCGKNNDYGHPHRETVALFKKTGIELLRTDIDGSIVFVSDGKNIIKK
ncbi:MAG: MBL fold metallo-hydrolase [Oscillospiraceae bacterium]|nr:MBL fold metallo-hydrolase [Oscillospiraceae bacterium]